ncbi:MAG TPA: helix-turn-helix domain-containing protein [Gemmatimonadaceae bacterium]|jgi:transcriptional regulator GlxA family with amidase domain
MTASRPHRVAVLVMQHVVPFDLGVPCQIFGYGRPDVGSVRYTLDLCGVRKGVVTTAQGFGIVVPHDLRRLRYADTIVVPGSRENTDAIPREVCDALRRAHGRGARVMSICTGAFVLAEAGLLDGKRATTHWQDAPDLARRYPKVRVDPNVLFVDEGQVLTSAGISAGIDLCLHVVMADYGVAVANAVARRLVVPPHRSGGQAQFIETPMPADPTGSSLERTREWIRRNLGQALTIHDMAAHARMSGRHFARRFVEESGVSPLQWLLGQRVLVARELLENSSLSIKQIAARTGYGTPTSLRERFKRHVGTTPVAYRDAFRGSARNGNGHSKE